MPRHVKHRLLFFFQTFTAQEFEAETGIQYFTGSIADQDFENRRQGYRHRWGSGQAYRRMPNPYRQYLARKVREAREEKSTLTAETAWPAAL